MKKFFYVFLSLFMIYTLTACTPEKETPVINYDVTSVVVKVGESYKFEIEESVGYTIGDNTVISFDEATSTITGLAAGTTTVTIYLKSDTGVKMIVNITVNAKNAYTISYNLDGGVCTNLDESFEENEVVTLPTPTKENCNFLGWYEGDTLVETITNKNYTLVAKWDQYKFTITYDLDGGTCDNLVESFEKDEVVTLPTPVKNNCVFYGWYEETTLVETITNKDYNLIAKWEETPTPTEIKIITSSDIEIIYTDTEFYLSCKVLPEGCDQSVTWKALNRTKAIISEDGKITAIRGDEASFKVTSNADETVSATIVLNVRGYINPYDFIDSLQVTNPVATKIKAYTSNAGYNTYLLGGVVNYLFEDISIIENFVPVGQANRPGTTCNGNAFTARYVTFHDVGATGNAGGNSNYCKTNTSVSWHYTVGNEGIYQQLPLNEVGFHAGDGTTDALVFYDSGVSAPAGDDTPATITINQSNGHFIVNGVETSIVAPLNSESNTIVLNSQLPYTGVNNYVDSTTGHYMIGKTYWNSTYDVLANRGGNLNSIGIESTINEGSNIYYTWELSAKLISTIILPQTGLLPRDVKQHNTFSGKNCPQTMRRASMWENFMTLIENEYLVRTDLYSFKFEFSSDSEYINSNGMIKSLPEVATDVTYSIHMTNTSEGIDEIFTYTVTLPAASNITY